MGERKSKGYRLTISACPQEYISVMEDMDAHVAAMLQGEAQEAIWILRHFPIYTTTERSSLFCAPPHIPVVTTHRGGLTTYHDEGQIIIYPMLRLFHRGFSVGGYVTMLEQWGASLAKHYGITVRAHEDFRGVWVSHPSAPQEIKKIASVGVRIRRGITLHGLAFNFSTNLQAFSAIAPCGLSASHMTSLQDFGIVASFEECAETMKILCPF